MLELLLRRGGVRAPLPPPACFRPQLEALEARYAPSAGLVAVEGKPYQGILATQGIDGPLPNSITKVTVDWGDGTLSAGTAQRMTPLGYRIHGTHTYKHNRTPYEGSIIVQDARGKIYIRGLKITVTAAPVKANPLVIKAVNNKEFYGPVATLRYDNPYGTAQDLVAKIYWGERANVISDGEVVANGGGLYTIYGRHTYQLGPQSKTVRLPVGVNIGVVSHNEVPRPPLRGDTAHSRAEIEPFEIPPGFDLPKSRNAVREALGEFAKGFGDRAGALWQFLTADPVKNQRLMGEAIVKVVQTIATNPGQAVQGVMDAVRDALRKAAANPARALGALTFDLVLAKFLSLAQGKLLGAGQKMPGVSDVNPNSGVGGLNPTVAKELEGTLAKRALNQQILAAYITRSSSALRLLGAPAVDQNCVMRSIAGVHLLKGGNVVGFRMTGPKPPEILETYFNKPGGLTPNPRAPAAQVEAELRALTRPGSVGLIGYLPPTGIGHRFNYCNIGGELYFVDFSTGWVGTSLSGFNQTFRFNYLDVSDFVLPSQGPYSVTL